MYTYRTASSAHHRHQEIAKVKVPWKVIIGEELMEISGQENVSMMLV